MPSARPSCGDVRSRSSRSGRGAAAARAGAPSPGRAGSACRSAYGRTSSRSCDLLRLDHLLDPGRAEAVEVVAGDVVFEPLGLDPVVRGHDVAALRVGDLRHLVVRDPVLPLVLAAPATSGQVGRAAVARRHAADGLVADRARASRPRRGSRPGSRAPPSARPARRRCARPAPPCSRARSPAASATSTPARAARIRPPAAPRSRSGRGGSRGPCMLHRVVTADVDLLLEGSRGRAIRPRTGSGRPRSARRTGPSRRPSRWSSVQATSLLWPNATPSVPGRDAPRQNRSPRRRAIWYVMPGHRRRQVRVAGDQRAAPSPSATAPRPSCSSPLPRPPSPGTGGSQSTRSASSMPAPAGIPGVKHDGIVRRVGRVELRRQLRAELARQVGAQELALPVRREAEREELLHRERVGGGPWLGTRAAAAGARAAGAGAASAAALTPGGHRLEVRPEAPDRPPPPRGAPRGAGRGCA